MQQELLRFIKGNAKIGTESHTFSLPAGYTCPGAHACLAKANRFTGEIEDGEYQSIRCFAATMEARSPTVRQSRWRNFDLLLKASRRRKGDKTAGMADLIMASIAATRPTISSIRIHVGGDFFNEDYFKAWLRVAEALPHIEMWAYTKSIPYWSAWQDSVPPNLSLVASEGGKFDHFIPDIRDARTAHIVLSEEEAAIRGWEIDHDDTAARSGKDDFALLVHGTQKAGTPAAEALNELRRNGVRHSYPALPR